LGWLAYHHHVCDQRAARHCQSDVQCRSPSSSPAHRRRTRSSFRATQQTLGELNGIIEETITGEHVVKAFVRERPTTAEFSTVNRRLQKVALRARIFTSFMGSLMNMVNNLGLAIVACAGGWLAVEAMAPSARLPPS